MIFQCIIIYSHFSFLSLRRNNGADDDDAADGGAEGPPHGLLSHRPRPLPTRLLWVSGEKRWMDGRIYQSIFS